MRCPTCKGDTRFVPGNGPKPARIMAIGEAPGAVENHTGIPLTGPTGMEWDQTYLPLAGLDRSEVYATNARKCRPGLNRKPTLAETLDCAAHHLPTELDQVQPEIVILMGATACSLIPDIDLEVEHGIPRWGGLYGWEGWVIPMWHPALGLHETGAMASLLDDWEGVRGWLRGEGWKWAVDDPERDYGLIGSIDGLWDYGAGIYIGFDHTPPLCGVDTEAHGGVPYSVQFSIEPSTARMVRFGNIGAVGEWVRMMQTGIDCGMELVFHNAPADLAVIESLGVHGFKWRDTMQEAYHMGLPQALKTLSYRLLGRRRKSWEETVTPPSKEALAQWIMSAIDHTEVHWQTRTERVGKRGQRLKPIVESSAAERTLRSIFKHMVDSPTYDPWEKLSERMGGGMEMEVLEEAVGKVPVKGIAYVPEADQIGYACSDADDTLAVALKFEEMRKCVGADVREDDYDSVRRD